jgi:hypothetical protein
MVRENKTNKQNQQGGIHIGKREVKLSLFADDRTLKDSKESTRNKPPRSDKLL